MEFNFTRSHWQRQHQQEREQHQFFMNLRLTAQTRLGVDLKRFFSRFESLIILRVRSQFVRFMVSLAGGVIDIHLNEIR